MLIAKGIFCKMRNKIIGLGLGLLMGMSSLQAQHTKKIKGIEALYVEAVSLYEKQQYVAAQNAFEKVYKNTDKLSQIHMDAEYFTARCAIALMHPDAGYLLKDFESNHPTSPHVNEGRFFMANSLFDRKRYKEALEWFGKVDVRKLNAEDRSVLHFKKGYSHFVREENEDAIASFKLVASGSQYEGPAIFYHGHVAYEEGRNVEALNQFNRLLADDSFGPIVPFYIAQIYYRQKQYEKVIHTAPGLLEQASEKRAPELAHIIADSYYQLGKYEESLPFYQLYQEKGGRLSAQEYYQIGFANHKTGNFLGAQAALNKIVGQKDSLGQNAYYMLADCYLRNGDKQAAKNAFKSAAEMPYDAEIVKDARFNYVKLVYELEDAFANPGDELKSFMEDYPNHPRNEELYDLLVNYFLSTKDYQRALAYFDEKGVKTKEAQKSYQKIAYYRGVQYFNRLDWSGAIQFFNKSLQYKHDPNIEAKCYFWKAEAQFRDFDYSDALINYRNFKSTVGATRLEEYKDLNYNMAYAYFKLKDYTNAAGYFRAFLREGTNNGKMKHDAQLRTADCYFVLTDYPAAIEFYTQALSGKFKDNDYALFQLALCQGLQGRADDRIASLNRLINNYPNSLYIDDAIFELGNGFMSVGNYAQAVPEFERIINEYPNSSYVAQAMLNAGLGNYNQGNFDKSVGYYKQVAATYPNTKEAKEAVINARNVYVDMDQVDAYAAWVKSLPFADISSSSLDSTAYEAAEKPYLEQDCKRAIQSFSNYLINYEGGFFSLNAHYYRGQCYFKEEEYKKALEDYAYVIEQSRNTFTEVALLRASEISYYLKNYPKALEYFLNLEALAEFPANRSVAVLGAMRCFSELKKHEDALAYADKVLALEKTEPTERQEAHVVKARSSYALGNKALALTEYKLTLEMANDALKAEALYYIAELQFDQGEFDKAKEGAFQLIETMPDFQKWKAKALLLLSKCYWKLEDVFNATYILEQIIKNYSDKQVVNEAKELKAAIEADEARKKEMIQSDSLMELDINTENPEGNEGK